MMQTMESADLRLARLDEADAIDALMKASTADLFPRSYDAKQTSGEGAGEARVELVAPAPSPSASITK